MSHIFVKILEWILKKLSQLTIWRFQPKIIGITGSAGKTSTKEAIYAVLKSHSQVRKSEGNLNNELGLPLTILGDWSEEELELVSRGTPTGKKRFRKLFFWLKVIISAKYNLFFLKKSKYPEVLILEYAADKPGDIKKLLEIATPNIGIITTIGDIPVHVEFFSGPEAVAREKSKLVETLSSTGFAILNFDNEIVMKMKEQTRARVITFGFNLPAQILEDKTWAGEAPDLKISSLENRSETHSTSSGQDEAPIGISFKLEYSGAFVPVILKNCFGKAQAYAAASAACVGLIYDLNLVEISEALSNNYQPAKRRMNLLKGVKDAYIIDDTYNASPLSVEEAINTINGLSAKRKVAVLGDMLELGKYSIEAHESIGKLVAPVVDILVTVGPRAKFIAESAKANGLAQDKVLSFDTAAEAGLAVQDLIKTGDLVLIKASRAMGLERIVEEIKKIGPIV